jgi:hypothetical protein
MFNFRDGDNDNAILNYSLAMVNWGLIYYGEM